MLKESKLGLGTAQWGFRYGLSNQQGITHPETVNTILNEALKHGINMLDTAPLYGDSEFVLGTNSLEGFRVVTKTPRFAVNDITDYHALLLKQTFSQSLHNLSARKVYGLLIHHADDLLVTGSKKLISVMMELKASQLIDKIGVSIYDSEKINGILKVFKPDIVQLPINVLDQKMLLDGTLERLKNAEIEIHARSVFLQGLLLMPLHKVPPYFSPILPLIRNWHSATEEQGVSLTQAALGFVRDISFVDTVLVGIENLEQFQTCYESFAGKSSFDATGLTCANPSFVNPALWKFQ